MPPFVAPFRRAVVLACLALPLLHDGAGAQRVLGPGEEAWIPPRGVLRVTIAPQWSRARERYADGTTGTPEGEPEPLGAMFGSTPLDLALRPRLVPVQQAVRALSGLSAFNATLGQTQVDVEQMVSRTPITLELGVTRRIAIGVTVPYVMAQREVVVNTDPFGSGATLGLNPARDFAAARTQNGQVDAQFGAAITALQQRITACQADPAGTGCAAVVANPAAAQQLLTDATSYRMALATVFGTGAASSGADFVPINGTAVFQAIAARIAQLDASFQNFLAPGTPLLAARPFASQTAIALDDFQRLVRDPALDIQGDALKRVTRYGIGDVEVGATLLLLDPYGGSEGQRLAADRFAMRLAVGGLVRLGTGKIDSPDNFADIGTGDQQQDIEARVAADLIFGRRGWLTVAGRYGVQMADERERRLTESQQQAIGLRARTWLVERDLGDYVALELTPRWIVNEYVQLAGHYGFVRRGEDVYRAPDLGVPDIGGASELLDPAFLASPEPFSQQRVGGGVTWSTMTAWQERRTWAPMDVSAMWTRTIAGGGLAPKDDVVRVQLRVYSRLWGRDERPARVDRLPAAVRGGR